MKALLTNVTDINHISSREKKLISLHIENLVGRIKIIKKCMILNPPTFDVYNEKMFMRVFQDNIGFEASQNEVNLNLELKKDVLSPEMALSFFKGFNQLIKKQYPCYEYCAILSVNNIGEWIYRFHIVRDNSLWVDKDLESYREPILYEVF